MSNWFYTDASGQKQGPINNAQFGALVKQGVITRETVVENEQGQSAPARRVKGLVFPEPKQPEAVPPVEAEIYGLSSPAPRAQVCPVPPIAVSPPVAAPSDRPNPFTTAMPQAPAAVSNMSVEKFDTHFKVFWICMVAGIPLYFLLIGIPILIVGVVYGAMLLYQCWKLIPVDIARTTPGKAVGYCFIPLFNFYWFFVAFKGLGEDMNKTLQQRGIRFEVNSNLGLIFCILSVIGACLFPVIFSLVFFLDTFELWAGNFHVAEFFLFAGGIGSVLCHIAAYVFCILFLKSAKDGAVALLEPERASQIPSEKEAALGGGSVFTKVVGLLSSTPTPQPDTAAKQLFCTNCGNSVSEQAFACMSCGAKPVGYKKFCRQCGVGLNPEQIVCIKCGVAVGGTVVRAIPTNGGTSNTGFVWMYLIWLLWGVVSLGGVLPFVRIDLIGMYFLCPVCVLVTTIIWINMKGKDSLATVHGKNILNANFSYCLYYIVFRIVFFIAVGIVFNTFDVMKTSYVRVEPSLSGFLISMLAPTPMIYSYLPYASFPFIGLFILRVLFRLALSVLFIVSTIRSAIAAKEGNVKPYLLSIPFLKIQP